MSDRGRLVTPMVARDFEDGRELGCATWILDHGQVN